MSQDYWFFFLLILETFFSSSMLMLFIFKKYHLDNKRKRNSCIIKHVRNYILRSFLLLLFPFIYPSYQIYAPALLASYHFKSRKICLFLHIYWYSFCRKKFSFSLSKKFRRIFLNPPKISLNNNILRRFSYKKRNVFKGKRDKTMTK